MWRPDYTTRDEMKHFLRMELTYADDDAFIDQCIGSASREIDRETRRQFGKSDGVVSRTYAIPSVRRGTSLLAIDDLFSLNDVSVFVNGVDITSDVEFYPENAAQDGHVYWMLEMQRAYTWTKVDIISANWGWPEVPPSIKQGTEMMASRLYSRRDAPFGVIGSAEAGNQMLITRWDNDIANIVKQYYRWW